MAMHPNIEQALRIAPSLSWSRVAPPPGEQSDSRCYVGTGHGWRITVCDFSIEAQGFPKGARGHDGAALYSPSMTMTRLGHDAGKTVWLVAHKKANHGPS